MILTIIKITYGALVNKEHKTTRLTEKKTSHYQSIGSMAGTHKLH